ncbi:MAG: histidine--tRNA ligase [Spirochaetales bacterium]|nr:histidine--tRNA ligase [Spirochaetales bacterium]
MADIIQPRVLKGFRDFLPEAEMERAELVEILERIFRRSGFVPIDTPVLEYAEVLLGKAGGETEKQVYRFTDHGGRDVAMRFDLTVPFARFMAEHASELYLPFKRYHVAKVWRGENTQRGRYREFVQCDFDVVGTDCAGADFDVLQTIDAAVSALGAGGFRIRVNHRGVFNRFLEAIGLSGRSVEILRIVDKLEKIGAEETLKLLAELTDEGAARKVLEYVTASGDFEADLRRMTDLAGGPNPDSERLAELFAAARDAGFAERLILDPSITRGLDYYTGVVFETTLDGIPEIGSVCSGGRYNDLASLYTKQKLPGVGASVGMDRLLAALEAMGKAKRGHGWTRVLVLNVEDGFLGRYAALASRLRAAGVATEIYPERKKLGQQFSYAERKGIGLAIILGQDEAARGILVLKDLAERTQVEFAGVEELIASLLRPEDSSR